LSEKALGKEKVWGRGQVGKQLTMNKGVNALPCPRDWWYRLDEERPRIVHGGVGVEQGGGVVESKKSGRARRDSNHVEWIDEALIGENTKGDCGGKRCRRGGEGNERVAHS